MDMVLVKVVVSAHSVWPGSIAKSITDPTATLAFTLYCTPTPSDPAMYCDHSVSPSTITCAVMPSLAGLVSALETLPEMTRGPATLLTHRRVAQCSAASALGWPPLFHSRVQGGPGPNIQILLSNCVSSSKSVGLYGAGASPS